MPCCSRDEWSFEMEMNKISRLSIKERNVVYHASCISSKPLSKGRDDPYVDSDTRRDGSHPESAIGWVLAAPAPDLAGRCRALQVLQALLTDKL